MKRFLLAATLLLPLGCRSSPPKVEAPHPCKSNEDCRAGWACLAGTCADPARGASFGNPASAVTADKVQGEIERINAAHEKKVDKIIAGSE